MVNICVSVTDGGNALLSHAVRPLTVYIYVSDIIQVKEISKLKFTILCYRILANMMWCLRHGWYTLKVVTAVLTLALVKMPTFACACVHAS